KLLELCKVQEQEGYINHNQSLGSKFNEIENLRIFQKKQQKRRLHLYYLYCYKKHLAYSWSSMKDQGYNQSSNNVMNIRHVEVGRKICEVVGYVPGLEVDVDNIKFNFGWRNRKCCCLIRSGYDKTMFVILEELIIDKNIVENNDNKKKNRIINRLNKRKSIQIKDTNSENLSMKSNNKRDKSDD
ncbi:10856_t:CDS:2, partial [Racocetra persica]